MRAPDDAKISPLRKQIAIVFASSVVLPLLVAVEELL